MPFTAVAALRPPPVVLASGTPSVGLMGFALAAYALLVVPGVLLLTGRGGRRNLAWAVLPVVAALACAGLWALGTST